MQFADDLWRPPVALDVQHLNYTTPTPLSWPTPSSPLPFSVLLPVPLDGWVVFFWATAGAGLPRRDVL